MTKTKLNQIGSNINLRCALIDTILILSMLFVPTFSHLLPFPLYDFEPMRIAVLFGLLLSSNINNSLGLAIVLPLFSFCAAGHPIFIKSLLISVELLVNIVLFAWLQKNNWKVIWAMSVSILVSKLLYYGVKTLLVVFGCLTTPIITTNLRIQLIVLSIISLVFAMLYKKTYHYGR